MRARSLSVAFVLGLAGVTATAVGCSGTSGDEEPAVVAKRNAAGSDLARDLAAVENKYDACAIQLAKTGTCVLSGSKTAGVPDIVIVDPTIQDFPDVLGAAQQKIDQIHQIFSQIGSNICDVIGPFSSLDHPYFYYGASAQAGIIGQAQGGADVVWDMTNLQSAVFGYKGYGAGNAIGFDGGAYAGYGFGKKSGVLDAWSGRFCTATGSIGLPGGLLAANASVFTSPDLSVYGASIGISGGINVIDPAITANAFAADWGAWDSGTLGLSAKGFFVNQTVKTDPATGRKYVQYASPEDMALALLWNAPMPLGASAAAQVVALDLQRRSGLTIAQMCPKQAAEDHPAPTALQIVGDTCGALPSLPNGGSPSTSSGGSQSNGDSPSTSGDGSSSVSDGGGADVVMKDSCAGKADGLYCSQLVDFSSYQCVSGTIVGGQQCPNDRKCAGPNGPGAMIVCD